MTTSPSAACYFADGLWHGRVEITHNERIARDTYRVRFDCPAIARRITPGQFIMVRLAGGDDPLLARPLALYDTAPGDDGEPRGIDFVHLVVGKLTGKLAHVPLGQPLEVWGPLGNGFPPPEADHLIMVAGGIGQTPFLALAREALGLGQYGQPPRRVPPAEKVTLCYGARSGDLLAGLDDFEQLGVEVHVSTDDGTAGRQGLVTDVLQGVLQRERQGAGASTLIVCCGPEPMMAAVAEIAHKAGVACQVSLETPMACGIGICFSCVAKVRQPDGQWDYRRTCVEGPVFDARQILF